MIAPLMITLNGQKEYPCYSLVEGFDDCGLVVRGDDYGVVAADFTDIVSIDLFNKDGVFQKQLTKYDSCDSIVGIPGVYTDEDNNFVNAFKLMLKSTSLEKKVAQLEEQINPKINKDSMSLSEFQDYQKSLLGQACTAAIYRGVDVITSHHGKQHFSYTAEDQRNLKDLYDTARDLKVSLPYHADGYKCDSYTYQDIILIYITQQKNRVYQTTYCNFLNLLIASMQNKDEIEKITYGQALSADDQQELMQLLSEGEKAMNQILLDNGIEKDGDGNVIEAATT